MSSRRTRIGPHGPSSSVLALGAGLGLVAAGQLFPESWHLTWRLLVPAIVLVALWAVEAGRAPAGWERNIYGTIAVTAALLGTIFQPVQLLIGPVAVLCTAVACLSLVRRHFAPLALALLVALLPLNVSGLALSEGTMRIGLSATVAAALLAYGALARGREATSAVTVVGGQSDLNETAPLSGYSV